MEEGWVPAFCKICGHHSHERHVHKMFCRIGNRKNGFSKRQVRKISKILSRRGEYFDYYDKDIIYEYVIHCDEYEMREIDNFLLADLFIRAAAAINYNLDHSWTLFCILASFEQKTDF